MTDIQRRLTDLLKAGVGDPPAHFTVQAVRRQRSRRHRAAAAGAAIAVAVVAATSIGVSGALGRPTPGPAGLGSCRPGWSVTAGAVPAGDSQDLLAAIAGSAWHDLWAVGSRSPHHSRKSFPLIEHWNGHRWTYSAGAPLSGRQAILTAVAAPARNDVWAVGYFESGPRPPLIEHWNGRSWSLRPTEALAPVKAVLPDTLYSVTALAPNDVWILGTSNVGTGSSGLTLHWNGTSWHLAGPIMSPHFGLAAMNATGTDHLGGLWAVGGWLPPRSEPGVPSGGIVEQLNGSHWQVDNRYAWNQPLTLVAPVTPNDVWAIAGGNFTSTAIEGISPVRVLHWNGRTWQVALNLSPTASLNPTGLVALSADDVYVMGQGDYSQRAFIDHWDGTRWQNVPLGPAAHLRQRGGSLFPILSPSLTVTPDGSVAALVSPGQTDKTNYLWLRCQRH
jgi:hypothetical protein